MERLRRCQVGVCEGRWGCGWCKTGEVLRASGSSRGRARERAVERYAAEGAIVGVALGWCFLQEGGKAEVGREGGKVYGW